MGRFSRYDAVHRARTVLTARERELLTLHRAGVSHADIATRLGLTKATVSHRISMARELEAGVKDIGLDPWRETA